MQTHIVFGPLHPLCVFLILLINGSQSLSSSVPSVLVTTTLHRVTICIYFFCSCLLLCLISLVFQRGCVHFCLSPIFWVVCCGMCVQMSVPCQPPFQQGVCIWSRWTVLFFKRVRLAKNKSPCFYSFNWNSVRSPGDYWNMLTNLSPIMLVLLKIQA